MKKKKVNSVYARLVEIRTDHLKKKKTTNLITVLHVPTTVAKVRIYNLNVSV